MMAIDEPQKQKESYYVNRRTTKLSEILIGTGEEELSPLLMQNDEGLTPLHCCILFDAPAQLTRHILEHSSTDLIATALTMTSETGSTALHLAVAALSSQTSADNGNHAEWKKNAMENFKAALSPEACAVFNAHDQTPLMLAVQKSKKVSATVVRALLKELPKSSRTRNAKNFLPLHLAARNRKIKSSIIKGKTVCTR
jgi:ankyrin repeat protein